MQTTQLLPPSWTLPDAITQRLGDGPGRQRAMVHDGHLLLVLHAPPEPEQDHRHGRLFWRSPEGKWAPAAMKHGASPVAELIGEFHKRLDALDIDEDVAYSAQEYFDLMTHLNPLVRSVHNLHQALQHAREQLPDAKELIVLRDQAYALSRRAELLQADAKNAMDFVIARRSEDQAESSSRQASASHRLNVLAALTFPLLTICAIFGTNLRHGLEHLDKHAPTPLMLLVGAGLVLGALLVGYVTRK